MTADLWEGLRRPRPRDHHRPVGGEPAPLNHRRALPAFPVHTLPSWLVAAVAEETRTPTDLAGCLALSVIRATPGT
ncbi:MULTISPECIES: hypothetical protein [unclassified Streptomyces]|uniref:hypothetical protein n=1 Tax=unclassified Streptomyces TaxID=2593676 RepID=UPI002DDC51C4|nr:MULTISPECIES: hypothetical protein [unclassified Streptomyces]WSF85969.1 hypothetical protein OIE70_24440 [Streptomyces sp. NBC_01744]WSC37746.1 hypothetical protein OHA08_20765 [Streptomyces sp. NBC_01763]WSC45860.1 hypothetical protein OIE61_18895 [Streptomyces sp. NBC_01762]WSC55133.1 hypothetical protein OG808_24350 [Streptomyces sp. NBC_01761]WSD25523.1 hypothetical protein OHA26_19635 [Streptomyces sp. NBC_01751]